MKRLLLAIITMLAITHGVNAAWQGKLNLEPSVYPMVLREIHDGQYLYGISVPELWHLDHNGNIILHAGLYQAWNAESGNASVGPLLGLNLGGVGKEIGVDIPKFIGGLGDALKLAPLFKPISLFSSALSLDAFAGYRPIHTADVNGELVYGGACVLGIPFGPKNLEAGL